MTRWASPLNALEAARPVVTIALLVDLDFADGHIRVHDGIGTRSYGGNDYAGVGQFGGIELDAEDQEVASKGARLTLSGIPNDLVPDLLTVASYQGRAATIYIGLVDAETDLWIATPEELWSGQMDYMDVEYSGNEARVVLHVEDELRREPVQAWNTDEDQQIRFPGDRFFSDLPNVEVYKATWGAKQTGYSKTASAGGGGFDAIRNNLPALVRR